MGDVTSIEWCTHTFNPWEGCTKVSPGCAHCYAETRNRRFGNQNWGKGKPRRRTSKANWFKPHRWNNEDPHTEQYRSRVFCASLADWLDDEVPVEWLADLLKLIRNTPNLDWLMLTKRPENWVSRISEAQDWHFDHGDRNVSGWLQDWSNPGISPSNVWFGVSVEDQQRADKRIPLLTKIPARIRFLSVEPMLSPVQFFSPDLRDIHLIIFGGESGPGARPCDVEWIRDGVRQCRAAGVAPFVKQLGRHPYIEQWPKSEREFGNFGRVKHMTLKDKKGGHMAEWPEDLRVREFPKLK